jgi:glycosyltransferase involved in cell wall biosynthesis
MMSDNKPPVRVLHYFAFPGGGIGRYVHELLTRLRDQPEVEVELACIPSYHYLKQANYPTWPGLREITHPVPLRRRLRFAINLFVNPIRAIRRARLTGAQILHLSTIPHVTFALWSRKLKKTGLRLVATAHDVRRSQGLICYPYEIEQLKRLYRACDALFVHSEYQKQDLINFAGVSPEKVHIVPHGPSYHGPPAGDKMTLRKRYGVPLDKQVALFFGDIRPDKNLDLFLQAMVPYKDRLFLVVAGQAKGRDGMGISGYIARAKELGLSENILWRCEYIPDNEVPNLFELCDWVAMPYSSRFTSQSGVLNVAMAHHRPVLVSATPTIAETLENFQVGVMVCPDSLEELGQAIARFLNVGANCFKESIESYLKRYSWEKNASTTALVYEELQRACVE